MKAEVDMFITSLGIQKTMDYLLLGLLRRLYKIEWRWSIPFPIPEICQQPHEKEK